MIKNKFGIINVLLVEDNPGDVRLIRESFREWKYMAELTVISDGNSAINYLRNTANTDALALPDIILLDLNLPRIDGHHVLKEIKHDNKLKIIPVIIMTSSSERKDVLECYQNYANCFISKPRDLDNFVKVIKSIEDFWLTIVKLPG